MTGGAILEHPTKTSLVIRRSFLGPPALMWRIWTDPAHMARWFGPKGVTCEHTFSTPEVGGAWGCDVRGREGGMFRVRGTYLEMRPPHLLRSTWAWLEPDDTPGPESEYRVEFAAEGEGTAFTLTHELRDTELAKTHSQGWLVVLESLDEEVRVALGG